jgi:hypothetical protein
MCLGMMGEITIFSYSLSGKHCTRHTEFERLNKPLQNIRAVYEATNLDRAIDIR